MNKKRDSQTVVVTGDVTIDWNIGRLRRTEGTAQAWNADDWTAAFCQPGGVVLLAGLVAAAARGLGQSAQVETEVRQIVLPRGRITPEDSRFHHSYAMWAQFQREEQASGPAPKVWRVQEFLGLNAGRPGARTEARWQKVDPDPESADIVILDDAGLGFREHPELWPRALSTNATRPWVLLKMARPVTQGKLWEHLRRNNAERLIVVMTVNDLRSTQVQVSRQVSWERTAQDLVWELLYNPKVNTLALCAHVIVSFGGAGALLLSRNSRPVPEATLFFDPAAMEGEWEQPYRGRMIGYNTCLTAGIARELMLDPQHPAIPHGLQSGIRALRLLHKDGYGEAGAGEGQAQLAFPTTRIAAELTAEGKGICTATVRSPATALLAGLGAATPAKTPHLWTILEDKHPQSLEKIAAQIVREGLESALPEAPVGKFGKLKTVDRREGESLRSISRLLREYCERYQQTPLSIAVFGPPGAGKSFAVREVASSVRPGEIEALTFNLSQFGRPEDLFDAFHRVRDKVLLGKIPLVFWDEFDCCLQQQSLGWLRYFLAPMNDGEFLEGQIAHPIGRSIFVFAGGTCYNMEAFACCLSEQEGRVAKLPDFLSRLKGFINILGPNRQDSAGGGDDPYYVIRRAIILRSVLERLAPGILHSEGSKRVASIDQGVLRAFLLTGEYRHGARSLEAIVAMSQLAGRTSFERSCLPPEAQLDLHVDGRSFSSLIHRMEPDGELLEKLAEAFHEEVFCEDRRARGWSYGAITRENKKEHSSLKPYAELPENEKEQNRNNVRDIPGKLAAAGYVMLPARSGEAPVEFSRDEVERLAEMEHQRWMQQKLDEHWQRGEETIKEMKLHKDLVPWSELPEDEKEKDRVLVRGIPRILAKVGYTLARTGDAPVQEKARRGPGRKGQGRKPKTRG